jgi:PD-(D/E)XK nuclease superfamily
VSTPVQIEKKPIYVTKTGFEVYDFSHSQYDQYHGCGKKYELMRVGGWKEKPGAAREFGIVLQESVRLFYKEKKEPVESIESAWHTFKGDASTIYEYPDGEDWDSFNRAGIGLMINLKKDWQKFPPRDPAWPDWKRDPFKVYNKETGLVYQAVPDLMDKDEQGHFIADLKAMGNLLNDDTPGLVVNDLQLRTQAAATHIYRVALWNFCRKPKRVNPPTAEEIKAAVAIGLQASILEKMALLVARETSDMNIADAGKFLGIDKPDEVNKSWKADVKADPTLKEKALHIAEAINKNHKPQYVIQWVAGTMTQQHAEDGLREEMSVIPLIQQKYFPRRGGIRFPNNSCTWCKARGLCMAELHGPNPAYDEITNANLVSWDSKALDDL